MKTTVMRYFPLILILAFAPVVNAATDIVGKTVAVVGRVLAQHQDEDKQHPLQVKQPVFLYDVIESGVGSRAKFMMKDDSILKLGPNSRIILDELMVGADQQKSTVKQLKGHLRTLLGKKLKPKSHFRIETPVAVAGVRGTDFEVVVGVGGITAVRCFEGEVEVKNLMDSVPGQVILVPNVYTIVEEGKPPTPPESIPAGQPLQSVLGAKVARSSESDDQELEDSTVAESPETEETTEGGHSDPESEGGEGISGGRVAGATGEASSGQTEGGAVAPGSTAPGIASTATATPSSATAGSATTGSIATDSESTSQSTSTSGTGSGSGALAGDSAGNIATASSTTGDTLEDSSGTVVSATGEPSQDTTFDSLSAQEIQQVSANNFSESSAAGQEVLQQLGISEVGAVATKSALISDLTIDSVMDDVVEDSLGVGPEDTVPDPIADYGSISFDINFPTP